MKHADKVIELMAAYPGRPFVMRQIIHYINPRAERRERLAVQRAVHRVMLALAMTGVVSITPPKVFGGQARYAWKT